jgi:hypothetical protein
MAVQYNSSDEQSKQIEVTPEMIDSAWPILDGYDHDYSSAEKCLSNIFRAMQMARVPSAKFVKSKD